MKQVELKRKCPPKSAMRVNTLVNKKIVFFKREQEHSFVGNIEALIPNLALVFF